MALQLAGTMLSVLSCQRTLRGDGEFLAYSLGMCQSMKGKLNFVTKIEWCTLAESSVGSPHNWKRIYGKDELTRWSLKDKRWFMYFSFSQRFYYGWRKEYNAYTWSWDFVIWTVGNWNLDFIDYSFFQS